MEEEKRNLNEEELKKLQEFDKQKTDLIFTLGQIRIEINSLEDRINELKVIETSTFDKFNTLARDIKDSSDELEKKYGTGIVNLQTGEITLK